MIEYLALALGVVVLVLVPLVVVIRMMTMLVKQVVSTNEKLMVLVGTRDGGEKVGRTLVESMKEPKKDSPGVATNIPAKVESRPTGKPYSVRVGGIG